MVFRLPTNIGSFLPSPSEQQPSQSTSPWRGILNISGLRASDQRSSHRRLHVTAVETDGDNCIELWPNEIFASVSHRPILKDAQSWVSTYSPPICTFLPERLRNPDTNTVNQTNFRSLSTILFQNETIAIAPWNAEHLPGGGIIILPAPHSSALLIGILFLTSSFPSFVTGEANISPTSSHSFLSPHAVHYPQPLAGPSTSTPYVSNISHNVHSRSSYSNDDQYNDNQVPVIRGAPRYTLPHLIPPPHASGSNPNWRVKNEEESDQGDFQSPYRDETSRRYSPQ